MRTLKNLCLGLIIKRIDRFYFASVVSKDKKQQQNIEFLQNNFSDELARELFRDNGYIYFDLYFNFVINKHLSFLNCKWFRDSRHLESMENIFCRLPNLSKIFFSSRGDEILKNITKFCSNITEISANFSDITDEGIKYLCEFKNDFPCPKLKIIKVFQTHVTDRGAEYFIRNCPTIETFDYPNLPLVLYSVHKENLSQHRKEHLYNLVHLDFYDCEDVPNYTDVLETCLDICPKLESIVCWILEMKHLSLISNNYWKRLDLNFLVPNCNINIDNFLKRRGSDLSYLSISNCTLSASALTEYCPSLDDLSIKNVILTDDDDLKPFFGCLTQFYLSESTDQDAKTFSLIMTSSPKLEHITFVCCTLCQDLKSQILIWCRNPSAKIIYFMEMQLGTNFLRNLLLSGRSLVRLVLYSCEFDVADAEETLESLLEDPRIHIPDYPRIQ